MEDKLTEKINNETPTKCICHKGFIGYASVVARSNFCVGGQDTIPQSLTAHTLDRYQSCYADSSSDLTLCLNRQRNANASQN
ncbi:MAG: hypothetical protein ACPLYF_05380 [Fervidobacterium sp.]